MQLRSGTITGFVNPSQAHYRQQNITVKFLGAGDNGDVYAAIPKADANLLIAEHCGSMQALYDKVRSNLQAVKFYKESNLEGDLSNEINFLTQAVTAQHPRLTPALDSHLDGAVQWLASPFCSGGNLQSFMEKHAGSLPTSFIWHTGAHLAEGVCFLLEHSGVVHQDIFAGNTLLQPPTDAASAFGNYPDLRIADFGRAKKVADSAPLAIHMHLMQAQLVDIAQIGRTLLYMRRMMRRGRLTSPNHIRCPVCFMSCREACHECCTDAKSENVLGLWLERFMVVTTTVDNLAQGLTFLKRFAAAARQQRAECYQPLPDQVVADLAAVNISNEEVAIALTQLRK